MRKLLMMLSLLIPLNGQAAEPSPECAVNTATIEVITEKVQEFGRKYQSLAWPQPPKRVKRCISDQCPAYEEFCRNQAAANDAAKTGTINRALIFRSPTWPQACVPYVNATLADMDNSIDRINLAIRQCQECAARAPAKESGCH